MRLEVVVAGICWYSAAVHVVKVEHPLSEVVVAETDSNSEAAMHTFVVTQTMSLVTVAGALINSSVVQMPTATHTRLAE